MTDANGEDITEEDDPGDEESDKEAANFIFDEWMRDK